MASFTSQRWPHSFRFVHIRRVRLDVSVMPNKKFKLFMGLISLHIALV
jgi:hypothetical protein